MPIHSGLKPTNILVIMDVVFEVSAQEYFSVKRIDFGLAKTEDHSQIVTSHCTTVGTEIYCAPDKDVILEEKFPRRSDVRSLGMMLSLILNGKPPSELTDGQKVSGLPGRIKKDWKPLELLEDCPDYSLMQERLELGNGGRPFSISEALDIMLQVAEGMLYLHEMQIVHCRDLKSLNILVKHMKATEVGINNVHVKVGTTRWMAPETIPLMNEDGHVESHREDLLKYPSKVDVYSYGMVCFEILTGIHAFPKPDERPRFDYICAELRHLKCAHYMSSTWTRAPRDFRIEEIKRMTKDFSVQNRIGGSNYPGKVYKGEMVDTGETVAVKCYEDIFLSYNYRNEMAVLPQLHHKNVVDYAGFCSEGEGILVFEYTENGSLDKWLFDDARKVKLTWRLRQDICLGVANGDHIPSSEAL
ncbi:hypothetical protein KC19_10G019300 [Ceratodon purpureus]|uniref:Protein kinase domain-containing protein n=1 Tax=Ceratodon purpureus TaxID=3225 RepID=A0A8T0GIB6_CERPU|nr:hypothetical protein KC19_10G019300 [Ceratodon purpureus]